MSIITLGMDPLRRVIVEVRTYSSSSSSICRSELTMISVTLTLLQAGNTYPSYSPPSHRDSPSVQIQVAIADRLLHHLQHAQNMMAFSERVAMPPMREPAPGSLSPSSLSPDFKRRDLSPSRPSSRDGQLPQRSDTSHCAQPQKRTRKLAATGECSLPTSTLPFKYT